MFDPNKHAQSIEAYLSKNLGGEAVFVNAKQLQKSTREAPWQLMIEFEGELRSFVLQLDQRQMSYEFQALQAVESLPIPTPMAFGLDLSGEEIGVPCFFSEFIVGGSLLDPLRAGEKWAETLYIDAVLALQAVTRHDLGDFARIVKNETAEEVLEEAHRFLQAKAHPTVSAAYQELKRTLPPLPETRFSNGDLWLENFIVRDRRLAGVIDFANATFSDPIYEFLLTFFVLPELTGRGIEEHYCERLGADPAILHWYHGLEYFDTLRWVMLTGENFEHHTAESLKSALEEWLSKSGQP